MPDKKPKFLQKDVADKYDLVYIKPGKHDFPKYGVIDLTKLTVAKADQLVAAGFPYLVLTKKAVKDAKAAEAVKQA